MAVIRPFSPPVVNPQATPQRVQTPAQAKGTAEARAAQRAFFQHALGDSTPVRAAPVAAPTAHSQPAQPVRAITQPIPDEPPTRILRPGSFVDIKI
jgi:hypothetical protein